MTVKIKEEEKITDYLFDISKYDWVPSYDGTATLYGRESEEEFISSDYLLDLEKCV